MSMNFLDPLEHVGRAYDDQIGDFLPVALLLRSHSMIIKSKHSLHMNHDGGRSSRQAYVLYVLVRTREADRESLIIRKQKLTEADNGADEY